ncbi:MAG TPA: serine/threonine-protein kinase [Streptosporangiaceae bacterium]
MTKVEDWAVPVPVGYRVAGWEVVRAVATGSWGSVYEGRRIVAGPDADTPDRVALKFLPTGTLTPRQVNYLADMAARELSLHSALSHPRLIRLYEALTVDDERSPTLDGAAVLVMDLARESVAELLDAASRGPVANAPRLIVELCEGLAHMHDNGWIHGDLKPRNILIMADGSLRLADFGLAVEFDGTHGYLPPAGSADYMPPERWDEPLTDRGRAVRTGSDIWALGITAYQMLTGRFPFPGSTARARMAAASEYVSGRRELPLPETLPAAWREWLADCLAPAAAARPTANELLDRARTLASYPAAGPARPRRRNLRLLVTTVLLAVMANGATAWVQLPKYERPHDPYRTWLRTDSDIPSRYRKAIVDAAWCTRQVPEVTPALVAASLKALSDFNPNLSDPVKDEYGIARWTPSVLEFYLPPEQKPRALRMTADPYVSIKYMGTYLCRLAPEVVKYATAPLQRQLLAAVIFQSNTKDMARVHGIPDYARWYADKVERYLPLYLPNDRRSPPPRAEEFTTVSTAW